MTATLPTYEIQGVHDLYLDEIQVGIRETSEEHAWIATGTQRHQEPLVEATSGGPLFLRYRPLSQDLNLLINEIKELLSECSEKGWDGYSAEPLSITAYAGALRFLQMWPPSFPTPEVVPEPDGSIGLEWYKSRGNVFIISFDGSSSLAYAGIISGTNKTRGTEVFADSIPETIQNAVARLFP